MNKTLYLLNIHDNILHKLQGGDSMSDNELLLNISNLLDNKLYLIATHLDTLETRLNTMETNNDERFRKVEEQIEAMCLAY